jgi:hypothetical protein
MPGGARPFPVCRILHQPSAHRVGVDVIDHSQNHLWLDHIVVEAASGLPETAALPLATLHGYAPKPLGGVFAQVLNGLARHGFLMAVRIALIW